MSLFAADRGVFLQAGLILAFGSLYKVVRGHKAITSVLPKIEISKQELPKE